MDIHNLSHIIYSILPSGADHPRRPILVRLLLYILLLPGALFAGSLQAQSPDFLETYLQEAAQNNPGLQARYLDYRAALQQVPQVTALPDPELSLGWFVSPIETRVGPQQARIGATQMFPWFGTLGARGDAAAERARMRFETFREERNRLFMEVERKWYKLYRLERSIALIRENLEIVETFETLATQNYETGQTGQVDVLRVQIEKEDLKSRLEQERDNREVALREFRELLNREDGSPVAVPDTLEARSLPMERLELLQAVRRNNPRLEADRHAISSSEYALDAARLDGYPTMGLGLDYMVTGEGNMATRENGRDAVVARAGIRIPLNRGKYKAMQEQARLELRSADARSEAAANRLHTELEQALRDFTDAGRRLDLYGTVQIERTLQALDILTEQYAVASTDFEELLRMQRKLLDYELAREVALSDQRAALARIDYLYGRHNVSPESWQENRDRR